MKISSAAPLLIKLNEWDSTNPKKDTRLLGISFRRDKDAQDLALSLQGKVNFFEGLEGLSIVSTSYVGRIDIGPIRLFIAPKLPSLPLTSLLRYCYGLKDIRAVGETDTPVKKQGIEDLLISLLSAEIEDFLTRGAPRKYVSVERDLGSPRGRILMSDLASRGGIFEASLPCRYSERLPNWHLNSVLMTGIEMAASMANDRDLRRHLHRLSSMFGNVSLLSNFGESEIDRAELQLSRLTENARPSIIIIRLLKQMLGAASEANAKMSRTPGFLFDMNLFFQRLVSRFIRENTCSEIFDEQSIHKLFSYGPNKSQKRRRPPSPRPDFALYNNRALSHFLDAKYRDIWVRRFPIEWLYQLTAYSLASPRRVSVILYASMSDDACDELIEVRQPIAWSDDIPAVVVMRPVPLVPLAALLGEHTPQGIAARKAFADKLVSIE